MTASDDYPNITILPHMLASHPVAFTEAEMLFSELNYTLSEYAQPWHKTTRVVVNGENKPWHYSVNKDYYAIHKHSILPMELKCTSIIFMNGDIFVN